MLLCTYEMRGSATATSNSCAAQAPVVVGGKSVPTVEVDCNFVGARSGTRAPFPARAAPARRATPPSTFDGQLPGSKVLDGSLRFISGSGDPPLPYSTGLSKQDLGREVRQCRYGSIPPAAPMAWGVLPPAPSVRGPLMGTCGSIAGS